MTDSLLEAIACNSRELLKYGFSAEEFATLAQRQNMTNTDILAVAKVFEYLKEKKTDSTIDFMLRTSRLPLKVPKTFDNFDFDRVTGKNVDKLRSLSTLSALYAHRNLAFIGKPGTGKTHLAQAFGRACCEHGFKTYFIKMTELRDRMTDARRSGKEGTLLASLVRPSCLIIDEVGHCEFDKENTRLFFDMVDRRYQKDGYYNMVFTSNRDPAQWQENFSESDSLLCALDRIFDDAVVFTIKGESFRGRKLETVSLRTAAATPTAVSDQREHP
ncbi:MAG: ATP-binding protein [Clostridiales bacterium]|nr:ATP-binding protein [Clostridiales bacterium]